MVLRDVSGTKGGVSSQNTFLCILRITGISMCALSFFQNVVLVLICCKQTNFLVRNDVDGLICPPTDTPLRPRDRCFPRLLVCGHVELSVMFSHSYGKLLRCLLIVVLFQMVSGGPHAAGADIVCTVSFNLLTAIKLQSHMGSR